MDAHAGSKAEPLLSAAELGPSGVDDACTTTLERLRQRLDVIIFGTDTRAGMLFDVSLLVAILASILATVLESVHELHVEYRMSFLALAWCFLTLFSVEYVLRLWIAGWAYASSFYGWIDAVSTLPTLVVHVAACFVHVENGQALTLLRVMRVLRLLRSFRVFNLVGFEDEAAGLSVAVWNARRKIGVFLLVMGALVTVLGTVLYVVEPSSSGFSSIPLGIYWAIVTVTTVGYGDIYPQTAFGRALSSLVMLLGYSILAVPTGLAISYHVVGSAPPRPAPRARSMDTLPTRGFAADEDEHACAHPAGSQAAHAHRGVWQSARRCAKCRQMGHEDDALYCKWCGAYLYEGQSALAPFPAGRHNRQGASANEPRHSMG